MAKKKKEEGGGGGAPAWMATFSDLMNLLLCFFVLLFSMSSVDADKWEQVVVSMSSAFSIFSGGSSSIGEGTLIGMGTSQLSELDEYYNEYGQTTTQTGEDSFDKNDSGNSGQHDGTSEGGTQNDSEAGGKTLEEQLAALGRAETEDMLDQISELTERYNIADDMELSMDSAGKYVEITLSGSMLFDSGSAELKSSCLPLLSKVGDILKVYSKHSVDIIGHTDNVPMKSSKYDSNDILSSARAISAAQYLVTEKNIDVRRLSWTGRGEYEPIASNSTAEGRARNRRIEIRIYNSYSSN